MNGYFRIVTNSNMTELELYAPKDGGAALSVGFVSDFLNKKGISYDSTALNKGIAKAVVSDTKITICPKPIPPFSGEIAVKVSDDKMQASVLLYAPSQGDIALDAGDLRRTLEQRGVTYGFLEDTIFDLVEKPRYCEEIVVAQGDMATASQDGYIEYFFDTDMKRKPTLLEDGSVDFFNLNLLQVVAKDQVIAKKHAPVNGTAGHRVDSSIIPARVPSAVNFKYGNNIYISEDGTELKSSVDGSVSLVGEQVFVNDSLTFENVDPSTGNINFDGSVTIQGNVDTNFVIKAGGDVMIQGVVEGAEIEAGGSIIIAKGVNGMGKAKLTAGNNIIAKYMENVTATAGGYISSEAIMHSTITAGGDIQVDGRKGVISGGKATSGGCVMAKTLGAEMANDTIIEVGISPMIKREIQELRNSVAEKQKTIASIQPTLSNLALRVKAGTPLTNEQKVLVGKLMSAQNATNEALEKDTARLMELEACYNVDTASEVKVKGTVYPGTRICISDVSMSVKSPLKHCKFVRLRGDVKIASYE